MVEETYNLENDGGGEGIIGKDIKEDMRSSFVDEDYVYFEIARKGDNGFIYLKVLDSPYGFINRHTTGKRKGKQRIIPFNRNDYGKLFREEKGKTMKRISCSKLINLLEKLRPGMKEKIERTRKPDYEPTSDIEYLANEESTQNE